MKVLSRKREALLRRLVEFAGDPVIVQDALRDLTLGSAGRPSMEQLVSRIAELKAARHREELEVVSR